ncbi:hypothetical protein [Kineococcus rubinsiae]|uniref:hypothetical protein n=1 Tax=Kineococcus rubinsiae TaxID=2609562 RepID=UPI0014300B23|nr:hypothetical protein [Kineococcus rubinsiae]NIZ90351.1 hypothetical protein [Kineococcus rubinsiae]
MTTASKTHWVPDSVLELAKRAVSDDLLSSAEAMAAALVESGWVRRTGSGSWSCTADASWTVESSDHAPNLSISSTGEDDHLFHLAAALRALIESGQVEVLQPGQPDPDWNTWSGGQVVLTLYTAAERRLGKHQVRALMQLAIERADTPSDGLRPDPQRARHLAQEGSPITRWYLASDDHLPQDVVGLLAADEDSAVVAALGANEGQRRIARGHH